MSTDSSKRLPELLDRLAVFIAVLGVATRWFASGETAGTGMNLFIHLLPWLALAGWFAARALEGGGIYRFTGMEFALLAFSITCLISVQRAEFKLAAIDRAMAFLSCAILFVTATHVLGRETLLRMIPAAAFALGIYAFIQYFHLLPDAEARAAQISEEMARRARSREVFATFAYPNSFAGFLVLVLPLLGGMLADARKLGLKAMAPPALAAAAAFPCLFLTGSTGAYVALAAAAAAFLALAATRNRGRRGVVIGGAIAAVLAVGLSAPLLSTLAARGQSMRVRSVYWTAALRIFFEAPVLGVGLDNFEDRYFQLKSDIPQETQKAHNDYLQILAETGAVGLLAFLALLVGGLAPALRTAAGSAPYPSTDRPSWLVPAAAVAGLLMSFLVIQGIVIDEAIGLALGLGAAWLAAYLPGRRAEAPLEFTRVGLAAGLAGLLVHMTVDFDLYDMGVAMSLFLALALATLLAARPVEVRLPRGVCGAAAGVLLAVALPLLAWMGPGAMAADNELRMAQQALGTFLSDSTPGEPRTAALSDAIRLSQAAQEHNPFDPESFVLFSRAQKEQWEILRRHRSRGDPPSTDLRQAEEFSLVALERALALRPRAAGLHDEKARLHRDLRLFYLAFAAERPASAAESAATAESHLLAALEHARRAADLYPTSALLRYHLGRALDLHGEEAGAPAEYQEALRLDRLAAAEKWAPLRLRLPPLPRARALRRTNRPFEGDEELLAALREPFQGRERDAARRLSERVREEPWRALGGLPDEADDLMRPVIKDVLERILGEPLK